MLHGSVNALLSWPHFHGYETLRHMVGQMRQGDVVCVLYEVEGNAWELIDEVEDELGFECCL